MGGWGEEGGWKREGDGEEESGKWSGRGVGGKSRVEEGGVREVGWGGLGLGRGTGRVGEGGLEV